MSLLTAAIGSRFVYALVVLCHPSFGGPDNGCFIISSPKGHFETHDACRADLSEAHAALLESPFKGLIDDANFGVNLVCHESPEELKVEDEHVLRGLLKLYIPRAKWLSPESEL